jgi:RimJ/RimL family protein N-acetyltransferase
MRTLRTPAFVLEPLLARHAPEMFRVLSDPAIYEFENEPPQSEAALTDRYAKLESRRSKDGAQTWLNWVVRLPSGELAGYVQATVLRSGLAYVAYELASRHWRQGIGSGAVAAMLEELGASYGVTLCVAVLKARNHRSAGLLRKLGFRDARDEELATLGGEADELVMVKAAGQVSVCEVEASDPESPEGRQMLAALSRALEQITGSSGAASFEVADMRRDRACFAIARSPSGAAVGCGAIRPLHTGVAELKRMFAAQGSKEVGRTVLAFLERKASELGYRELWLETRKVNRRAVAFYERNGYRPIPSFGRYVGREDAVCLGKSLPTVSLESQAKLSRLDDKEALK